jgi:hypothetical protein
MDERRSMIDRAVRNDLFVELVVMQNTLAVVQRKRCSHRWQIEATLG